MAESERIIILVEGASAAKNTTAISTNIEEGASAIEEEKWKVVQSVTAGVLCLLKVRFALLDHVAMLGHLPQVRE